MLHSDLTSQIIGAAIAVHSCLGPGLLESAYEACLAHELTLRGRYVVRQKPMPVAYRGKHIGCGYRIDLLVEDTVVVEIKAVEKLHPIHRSQLLTYMRLLRRRVGLLINFNVERLVEGLERFVI